MCLHRHVLLLTTLAATGTLVWAEPASHEVEVNGVTMSYAEEGTGEPILFVHGAVSDARAWEPIRAEISDQHRFIAPTLRYFGTEDWPDEGENFSVATHADDVTAFIEALDLGPVHLVGWSYGANVATAVALDHPDLVQSLVLYEPSLGTLVKEGEAGEAAREAAGQMFGPVTTAVQEGDAEKATRALIEGVFQMEPGSYESLPQEMQDLQLANARTMPLLWSAPSWDITCEMLGQLNKPTLLVHGGDSNAFWRHVAQSMSECLPQAEVGTLPGVNHNGPVSDPVGLAAMIEAFVAGN
ncbi:alpha/beta fold hydrolase [Rubellimicrobium roseum]|uniref:Alpha/beta hydrolase n=1 Tax=Rubellimicrobium roseum TaxID=687525 RepID=A0A5C4N921_9RHOB|nr:alpha/beta hydrolase [Rubellimicrobium roseum]TNC62075.1 alpha/beta hydrolase [Rubellimicrobium roseum]